MYQENLKQKKIRSKDKRIVKHIPICLFLYI